MRVFSLFGEDDKVKHQSRQKLSWNNCSYYLVSLQNMDPVKCYTEVLKNSSFDGSRPVAEILFKKCGACFLESAKSCCGRCKAIFYCNIDCQRTHWKVHKLVCQEFPWLQQVNKSSLFIGNNKIYYYTIKDDFINRGFFRYVDWLALIKILAVEELFAICNTKQVPALPAILKIFEERIDECVADLPTEDLPEQFKEKLSNLVVHHFKSSTDSIKGPLSSDAVIRIAEEVDALILKSSASLGFRYPFKKVSLTQDQEKVWDWLSLVGLWEEPIKMSCFSYMLFKIDAVHKPKDLALNGMPTLDFFIHTLNCESVSEPMVGDIVVYFQNMEGPIEHVGLFSQGNKVESKPGNGSPNAFTLDLLDRSEYYGRNFAFFRLKKG